MKKNQLTVTFIHLIEWLIHYNTSTCNTSISHQNDCRDSHVTILHRRYNYHRDAPKIRYSHHIRMVSVGTIDIRLGKHRILGNILQVGWKHNRVLHITDGLFNHKEKMILDLRLSQVSTAKSTVLTFRGSCFYSRFYKNETDTSFLSHDKSHPLCL